MLLSKELYITCIIDKDILYKLYSEDYTQDISKTQYQKKIYKVNWFLINYSMQEEYKFEVDQSKKKNKDQIYILDIKSSFRTDLESRKKALRPVWIRVRRCFVVHA